MALFFNLLYRIGLTHFAMVAGQHSAAGGVAGVCAVDADGICEGATVINRFVRVPGNGVVERCWCKRGSFRAVKGDVIDF
jgi:hypothetical protein